MTIKTNNVPRPLHALVDLPDSVRAQFDYIDEDESYSARLFQYRGSWYDSHEFQSTTRGLTEFSPLKAWDAFQSESMFSAVLIRFMFDDCGDENVIVGYFYE